MPRLLRTALFVLAVPLVSGWGRCGGNPRPVDGTGQGWKLVWQDEFDGAQGTAPDATRWDHDVGGDGWGNNQLEYDTDRTENAALDGAGNLVITARKESYGGNAYTSARLLTRGRFDRAYGRFEARIKLPSGAGLWPAFWLLGSDIGEVGWPECGELDVMEYRGQQPLTVHGSVHGPGYSGGAAKTERFTLPGPEGFDDGFHVFSVEWEKDLITWFVDGRAYHQVTPSDVGGRWAFDHPFFVILNLAVGGNFVGPPDGNTQFPQAMTVDYVRVYEWVE